MPSPHHVCSFLSRLAGFTCAVFATLSCAPPALAEHPNVVVTVKPIHALVAAVMAGAGTPQLIVEGSSSPHTFTLRPSAARAIEAADIFVRVSEATELFTRRIVETLPASATLITLADTSHGVMLLDQRASGAFESHMHGDAQILEHEEHGAKDGHVWLDPGNAKAIVSAVAEALVARDTARASIYQANAEVLKNRIDALDAEIELELAPVKNKPFIVFHDAYQYFEHHFGLAAVGAITLSPEQQTSARRLSEIRQKIKDAEAVCVFAEPGFKPNLVEAVREGTGARTATLDPEGLTLSPGPELYFSLMRSLARDLKACLSGP